MAVFVLGKTKRPLMPCSEKRARKLLQAGRAVVHRLVPFTIRLKDRIEGTLQPLELKLDPGSKTTGIALVRKTETGALAVLNLFELMHRGRQISQALTQRSGFRRGRRSRKLRCRAPRFDNRRRPEGWLAPSLQHRVDTTMSWVRRLSRWVPIDALVLERVKFDLQRMQNPEISGVEYQQGELAGYEVREYLLEKLGRHCQYCDAAGVPLEVEHIMPKSRGGSNRVGNLTLACRGCNKAKDSRDITEFLAHDPHRLHRVLARAKAPLRDAAAVNSTREALFRGLLATGLPVETGSGGQTKFNRRRLGIPKTHALDAVCVGEVTEVKGWHRPTLAVSATGRGSYKRTRLTAHGTPRGYLMRAKRVQGFGTGDHVVAKVPSGKKAGQHVGRVAVRASGSFNVRTNTALVQGISHRHCRLAQRADGYGYFLQPSITKDALPLDPLKG